MKKTFYYIVSFILFCGLIQTIGCYSTGIGGYLRSDPVKGTEKILSSNYELDEIKKPTYEDPTIELNISEVSKIKFQTQKIYREKIETNTIGTLVKVLTLPITFPLYFVRVLTFDDDKKYTNNELKGEIEEKEGYSTPQNAYGNILVLVNNREFFGKIKDGFIKIDLIKDLNLFDFDDSPGLISIRLILTDKNYELGTLIINPIDWTKPYFVANEKTDLINVEGNEIIKIGTLKIGQICEIIGQENNLFKVKYDDKICYINPKKGYKKYLNNFNKKEN